MAQLGRRDFLKGAAAVAVAGVSCRGVTAGYGIRAERLELLVPDLHPAHDGLRLAQISDLHVGHLTPVERVRSAIAAANRFEPELVALTGDYLTRDYLTRQRSHAGLILEQLWGLAAPTVAVLGNHDRWVDPLGAVAALDRLGYCVLRNENTTLSLRGEPFTVVGIDDLTTRNAEPTRAMKGAAPGSRLYLAHVPWTARILRRLGRPVLVLSGHTHGGQVNLPLLSAARVPYKSGLYRLDQVQLYVNRGVGNTFVSIRVNAPPEVTLLTLRSGAAPPSGARFPDEQLGG